MFYVNCTFFFFFSIFLIEFLFKNFSYHMKRIILIYQKLSIKRRYLFFMFFILKFSSSPQKVLSYFVNSIILSLTTNRLVSTPHRLIMMSKKKDETVGRRSSEIKRFVNFRKTFFWEQKNLTFQKFSNVLKIVIYFDVHNFHHEKEKLNIYFFFFCVYINKFKYI